MKKLILILFVFAVAYTQAQTDYSPTILYKEIPYPGTNDTIVREVKMNMTGWDNKKMDIHLTRYEYANKGDSLPHYTDDITFPQLMAETYTHYRDNGNPITNTGRWFVETIFETGAIDWALWMELGRSIYFNYWDTNEDFIRNE